MLPISSFYKAKIHYNRRGYRYKCIDCWTEHRLLQKYGITSEEYEALARAQKGLCAVCHNPPNGRWQRLHVDHDHKTGLVRGLLCFTCNTSLGHFEKNEAAFRRYLGE